MLQVGTFIPGLDRMVGEPYFLEFTRVLDANSTHSDAVTLSQPLGILLTGIAIDSAAEFTFKLHTTLNGDMTSDGDNIYSNTFSGRGVVQAMNDPVDFPCAWYLPGSTTVTIHYLNLSGSTNLVNTTLAGVRVRAGSQFERDLMEANRYIGL